MAFSGVKAWHFRLFFGILIANNLQLGHPFGQPKVPCYFIFGDSYVDNGNNNHLITLARANYKPYGIDFGNGIKSTGRFTNGRNLADFIAEFLGFDSPRPPFATAKGPNVIGGVNYGSGSSGIRDETAIIRGDRISLNRQLLNHQITISRITSLLMGKNKNISVEKYLSKCLYTVTIGTNDYINNYLLPEFFPTSQLYTPQQYADVLSKQYSQQLTNLYKLGARKIAIFGVPPLGCLPEQLKKFPANESGCVDFINDYVDLVNDKLKAIVDDLNTKFTDAKFTLVNTTNIAITLPFVWSRITRR